MTTPIEYPLLRATTTTDHAAYAPETLVNQRTGEMVDPTDTASVRGLCGAILDQYASAFHRAEAARLAAQERRAEVIGHELARLDDLLANDPEHRALLLERARAEAEAQAILEGLNGALVDRDGEQAISLDAGSALVTWGKARSTWTLAWPASWYSTAVARIQLNRLIRTVHGLNVIEADDVTDTVFDWLNPTEKRGELPPVRVTLRPTK